MFSKLFGTVFWCLELNTTTKKMNFALRVTVTTQLIDRAMIRICRHWNAVWNVFLCVGRMGNMCASLTRAQTVCLRRRVRNKQMDTLADEVKCKKPLTDCVVDRVAYLVAPIQMCRPPFSDQLAECSSIRHLRGKTNQRSTEPAGHLDQ